MTNRGSSFRQGVFRIRTAEITEEERHTTRRARRGFGAERAGSIEPL